MVDPTGRMTARHHRQWMLSRRTEITVIDDSDFVGWAASFMRSDEIYMKDVGSMVANVLRRSQGAKIKRLNILDHGNKYSIQIGRDRINVANIDKFEPALSKLRGHFDPKGFVHLQHCDAGQNIALLTRLAAIWGVPVYAGTGKHNPVYRVNFGDYVRCYPDESCMEDVGRP